MLAYYRDKGCEVKGLAIYMGMNTAGGDALDKLFAGGVQHPNPR